MRHLLLAMVLMACTPEQAECLRDCGLPEPPAVEATDQLIIDVTPTPEKVEAEAAGVPAYRMGFCPPDEPKQLLLM